MIVSSHDYSLFFKKKFLFIFYLFISASIEQADADGCYGVSVLRLCHVIYPHWLQKVMLRCQAFYLAVLYGGQSLKRGNSGGYPKTGPSMASNFSSFLEYELYIANV